MLNDEQQKMVVESEWVINACLKKHNCSHDEDLKQDAFTYLCIVVQRFDPTKNIKWTTYAYKSIYLYMCRILKRRRLKQEKILDKDITEYEYFIPDKTLSENAVNSIDLIKQAYKLATKKEREYLQLRLDGYIAEEIAEIMQVSAFEIKRYSRLMKERITQASLY